MLRTAMTNHAVSMFSRHLSLMVVKVWLLRMMMLSGALLQLRVAPATYKKDKRGNLALKWSKKSGKATLNQFRMFRMATWNEIVP